MDLPHLPNPQGRDDRRLVNREEGLNLLFAAAQDVAREEGKLADGHVWLPGAVAHQFEQLHTDECQRPDDCQGVSG